MSLKKRPGSVLLHFRTVGLQFLTGNCHDKYLNKTNKKPKQVNFSNTWLAISQTVGIYTDVDVENEIVVCFKVYSIKLFLFTVQTMCRHLFLCLIIMLNTGEEQIPTDVQFSKINQSANWWVERLFLVCAKAQKSSQRKK